MGSLFQLENQDGVLRRGHAALQEEDEDEEWVPCREEAGAFPCFDHGKGQGGHEAKALEHHQACPAEDAAIEAF